MITYTGVQMHPGGENVPTEMDIAVGMCRITRYAGALWVPLAAHSVLVAELAFQRSVGARNVAFCCGLLHDAHETVTGEVTRHYKPKEMKPYENELDELIFPAFGLDVEAYRQASALFKEADTAALALEATIHGLKGWPDYYRRMEGKEPPDVSADLVMARGILNFWSDARMIASESQEQHRLAYALSAVKKGEYPEARHACLPRA